MRKAITFGGAALCALLLSTTAPAALLFDSTATNSSTFFTGIQATNGIGQIIAVDATPKTITSFGFVVTASAGTKLKFILNRGVTENLITREVTLTRAYTRELLLSPDFLLLLPQINQQYTFGLVGAASFSLQVDTQGLQISQNGLTEIRSQNVNYVNYNNPVFDRYGLAELALVVNGINGNATAVPEPAAWATLVLGFGVVGTALRRRRRTLAAI